MCGAISNRRPILWEEKRGSEYNLTLLIDDQFLWKASWEKSLLIAFVKASSVWRILNIKVVFFFIINFLGAVVVILEFIMNKLINYSIISNGQNEYFWLRYLPKGLIQAQVLRDKFNEISKLELNTLLWSIKILLLILNQLENLESALESCRVETVGIILFLLPGLNCLFTGLSLWGSSYSLSEDLIIRGLFILCDH